MAKYLTNIDLAQNQLIRARIENQTSDPSGISGQIYYNSSSNVLKYHNGTAWVTMSTTSNTVNSISATSPLLANGVSSSAQTGAVTLAIAAASTGGPGSMSAAHYSLLNGASVSNSSNTLVLRDANGSFSANVLNVSSVTISGTPTASTDAATKGYVDGIAQGLDVKQSVRVATTASVGTYTSNGGPNVNGQLTAAPNTVDGVTLVAGDRILVKDHSTGGANGIYVVTTLGTGSNGVWDRAADFNASSEVTSGAFTFVEEGTVNDNTGWVLATSNPIVLGTGSATALSFVQFSGAGSIIAGNGLTKTGNSIDVVGTSGRISVAADSIDIDSGYVGQSSIATLGTVTTGTWSATTIAVNKGGTGLTSYTSGNLIYANGSTSLTTLAPNATGTKQFLSMTSSTPSWGILSNTDIPAFTGANGTVAGTTGGVSAPAATDNNKFLRGDNTWQTVSVAAVTSFNVGSTNGANTLLQNTGSASAVVLDFVTTPTGNTVLASPSGGGAGAPLFRSLVNADLPVVTVAKGGTGLSTLTTNAVLVGNGTSNVSLVSTSTQYQVLTAGSGGAPTWGAVNLAQSAAVTGTLPLANGGTNATTASGARTQLASDVTGGVLPIKVAYNIGDGSAVAITVTHNLNTRDIVANLILASTPWDVEYADITFPTTSTATVTFSNAPTTNQFRLVLVG